MLRNGDQGFAVRIRCDRRFATSQPAPAQRALDGVSALVCHVRRKDSGLEAELHDRSLCQCVSTDHCLHSSSVRR
jgi:hypothetical protein